MTPRHGRADDARPSIGWRPHYDALAAGEAFQLQRQQTHRLLSRWIRPGFRVLEIGCGTGARHGVPRGDSASAWSPAIRRRRW